MIPAFIVNKYLEQFTFLSPEFRDDMAKQEFQDLETLMGFVHIQMSNQLINIWNRAMFDPVFVIHSRNIPPYGEVDTKAVLLIDDQKYWPLYWDEDFFQLWVKDEKGTQSLISWGQYVAALNAYNHENTNPPRLG